MFNRAARSDTVLLLRYRRYAHAAAVDTEISSVQRHRLTAYISIKNTKLQNLYLIIFNADTFMPYRARSSEFLHFTR